MEGKPKWEKLRVKTDEMVSQPTAKGVIINGFFSFFWKPEWNNNSVKKAKEKKARKQEEKKRKMEEGKNRIIKSSKRKGGEKEETNKDRGCANARKIIQLNPAISDSRVTEICQQQMLNCDPFKSSFFFFYIGNYKSPLFRGLIVPILT